MAMLDIQRNHAVVFALRFGEKKNGSPAKLNGQLRITADNSGVVKAFADVYGGDVRKWNEAYEVYIPRGNLPVMFLPGQAIRQDWELYRGSVCERRCSGTRTIEEKSGKPCMCDPDIDKRIADRNQCSPKTELRFICPDVPVLGTGRLISHGKIAAETLPQEIQKIQAALERGFNVPATIWAVQKVGAGRQYVYPRIDLVGTSLNELMSGSPGSYGSLSDGRSAVVEEPPSLPAARSQPSGVERKSLGALSRTGASLSHESGPDPVSTSTPSSSAGPFANDKQRQLIQQRARMKKINPDALETLILEATGKYLDEADFTNEHVNKVLQAIDEKEDV